MRISAALVGLAVATTLVACGGDDDDEAEQSSTTTEATSTDTSSDDEDLAASIVLTEDDVPATWTATPVADVDDLDDVDVQAKLAECLGIDPEEFDADRPAAESPDFTTPTEAEVGARVSVMDSADEASRRLAILTDERAPGCLSDLFSSAIGDSVGSTPGVELGEVAADPLDIPALGDEAVAYRATVPFTAEGQEIAMYLDMAFVRVGRFGISCNFMSQGVPFDTGEAAGLIEIMVDRAVATPE